MSTNVDFVDTLLAVFDATNPNSSIQHDPFTGAAFTKHDDILEVTARAWRALKAQERFAAAAPDAPPLPIDVRDPAYDRQRTGYGFIHASYARSLERCGWDPEHVEFDTYARGVLAHPTLSKDIRLRDDLNALAKRFPPARLHRLSAHGIYTP